jgi:hypothetical protein
MQTNIVDNYSLQNIENFYSELEFSTKDLHEKYNTLFSSYFIFMFENMQVKNSTFIKFIIQRGLLTVTNVFNFILFYSKNLEMAYYHGQKAFYFYIEYIGQISEEHRTFLQLSSRDATMFVYKKTIFDIQNEFKKKISADEKYIFDYLEIVQFIHKLFMNFILEKINLQSITRDNEIINHLNCIKTFLHDFIRIKFSKNDLEIFKLFIERMIVSENMTFELYCKLCSGFLKQYNEYIDNNVHDSKEIVKNNILHFNFCKLFSCDEKMNIKNLKKMFH